MSRSAARLLGTAVCVTTMCGSAVGQNDSAQRHRLVIDHLKKTAAEISCTCLQDIKSLADWNNRRELLRTQLLYSLGLDPLPERTPLRAQVTGTLQRAGYRVEKIVFQSMPRLYVTANLYLPNGVGGRIPAILYVCGHSPHPLGAKTDYQDRAIWFAENGYACLILDTLEFGEVAGIHHGIHDLNMFDWLSRGYTPAGVEVWNAIRALDYLETRREVDGARIGMTGTSGGGATTWFTAAVDGRVSAAAPVCSTYTVGSQAHHWVAAGQCDCIYFHNTFLTDLPAVAALIAPRPLLICSGQRDGDFPPDGYHAVYQGARRIYRFFPEVSGGEERIREVDDDVGHSDAPLFRKEARQWMNRWLKGITAPVEIIPLPEKKAATPEELASLSGLPADALNYRIHDTFVPSAPIRTPRTRKEWDARRKTIIHELNAKVFRWFPDLKAPVNARVMRNEGGWASRYADYKEFLLETEPGVSIRAQLLTPRTHKAAAGGVLDLDDSPILIYVKRPGDSIYFLDFDELLPLLGRCIVLVVNPRLTEHPVSAFEYAEIERTASWIGRTVAGMQLWDVLRSIEWISSAGGGRSPSITVYGKGQMGILALYAGVLDGRVSHVVLRDPPASHRDGPALLNVLRITDIPEVAAAFAPRKLTFLREIPPTFKSSKAVYDLCGGAKQLTAAGSLPEAVEVWKQRRGR